MSVVCLSQAVIGFSSTAIVSPKNRVDIKTIDDNHAQLHFDNVISENRDILFTKQESEKGIHYTISDMGSQKEICSFDTIKNINLHNSNITEDKKMCAAVGSFVWAVVKGENPLGALTAAFGSAAGLIGEGTLGAMLGLIAEGGIGSIGAVIGLLSASEAIVVALGVAGLA